MVSQGSPSTILHHFLISDSLSNQNQHFNGHNIFLPHHLHQRRSMDLFHTTSIAEEDEVMNLPNCSISGENDSSFLGNNSFVSLIGSSKYLKPAQSLLEETVNGDCGDGDHFDEKHFEMVSHGSKNALKFCSEIKILRGTEFFSSKNHHLQIKIMKLSALLEEVESRYEKYYNQMEEVAKSFDVIAGLGSSKTYTSLALHVMSKHFCNLRDSILSQIIVTKRKIFRDFPTGFSQFRSFDRENRQNQTDLQQCALIQKPSHRQAWRPLRGLPETSVMILRSWLFEHFLNPYPNEKEKLMLASQTGLSKNQVSNWFINARVRLWKPMIEEMYKEEFADSSMETNECM